MMRTDIRVLGAAVLLGSGLAVDPAAREPNEGPLGRAHCADFTSAPANNSDEISAAGALSYRRMASTVDKWAPEVDFEVLLLQRNWSTE